MLSPSLSLTFSSEQTIIFSVFCKPSAACTSCPASYWQAFYSPLPAGRAATFGASRTRDASHLSSGCLAGSLFERGGGAGGTSVELMKSLQSIYV